MYLQDTDWITWLWWLRKNINMWHLQSDGTGRLTPRLCDDVNRKRGNQIEAFLKELSLPKLWWLMNLFFWTKIFYVVYIYVYVFSMLTLFFWFYLFLMVVLQVQKKKEKKTEMRALCAHPDHFSVSLPCTIIVDSLKLLKVA